MEMHIRFTLVEYRLYQQFFLCNFFLQILIFLYELCSV